MSGSILRLCTVFCGLLCVAQSVAAAGGAVEALLQLKELAPDAASLQSWQQGTDPCNWDHVSCEAHQVTAVDLSGVGLEGSLPAGWEAPATLRSLDLSNNKQLCGSAPVSRSHTMDVRAGGSGIGQPCGTKAVTTGGSPAGSAPADPENTGSSSLSSGARGAIGGAIAGVGVLAGAAAGTLFFLRRKKRGQEGLENHDLAHACDSVVMAKRKNHVKASVHNAALQGICIGEPSTGAEAGAGGSPRQGASLRMVAFADGCDEPEDKHQLRAANIQDSVVIIRNKMASGPLSSHMLGLTDDGSEHSWSSEGEPLGKACADSEQLLGAEQAGQEQNMDAIQGSEFQEVVMQQVQGVEQQECPEHTAVQVERPHSAMHQPRGLQQSPSKRVSFRAVPVVVEP